MAKIKLELSRLTVDEKTAKTRQITAAMNANPNFPTPVPALSALITAANELEAAAREATAARQTAKTKTTAQNNKEDAIDRLLTQEAGYVEAAAGGDEEKILSAGMDTKAAPSATTSVPDQPQGLTPTEGDNAGEIDAAWDRVPGARSYVIEISPDPITATSWKHTGASPKSSYTLSGLTSGTRYWIRVAAVGTNGQGPWSGPATKIAP
jgi:hypothetical protein